MQTLIIGVGGIGSWLTEEICACIDQDQIDTFNQKFTIADGDIIELEQLHYQNFKDEDVGLNKALALSQRFKDHGIKAIEKKITKDIDLKPFDFIILCVDNERTREMVVNHCFTHKKEFIDLRAEGRKMIAIPKLLKKEENMKFIDRTDTLEYSCQDKADLEQGWIQKGNKIIAMIGIQMILNQIRGHTNRPILLTV